MQYGPPRATGHAPNGAILLHTSGHNVPAARNNGAEATAAAASSTCGNRLSGRAMPAFRYHWSDGTELFPTCRCGRRPRVGRSASVAPSRPTPTPQDDQGGAQEPRPRRIRGPGSPGPRAPGQQARRRGRVLREGPRTRQRSRRGTAPDLPQGIPAADRGPARAVGRAGGTRRGARRRLRVRP